MTRILLAAALASAAFVTGAAAQQTAGTATGFGSVPTTEDVADSASQPGAIDPATGQAGGNEAQMLTCKAYVAMSSDARIQAVQAMDTTRSTPSDTAQSDGMTNMGDQIASYCQDNPDATVEDAMASLSD